MSNKLTSLTGFGEGDPKPEKKNNYGLEPKVADKIRSNMRKTYGPQHSAKSSALNKKMGKKLEVKDMGYGNISHLASTKKRGEVRFKGVSHWSKDPKDKGKEY